jgi:hypothetical protein
MLEPSFSYFNRLPSAQNQGTPKKSGDRITRVVASYANKKFLSKNAIINLYKIRSTMSVDCFRATEKDWANKQLSNIEVLIST